MNIETKRQITCACIEDPSYAGHIRTDAAQMAVSVVQALRMGATESGIQYCNAGAVQVLAMMAGIVAVTAGSAIDKKLDRANMKVDEAFREELHAIVDAGIDRAMEVYSSPKVQGLFTLFDQLFPRDKG